MLYGKIAINEVKWWYFLADGRKAEYRIFKQHMYGGPKGLGDPTYRELSRMEEDPMIPQRMRDITR